MRVTRARRAPLSAVMQCPQGLRERVIMMKCLQRKLMSLLQVLVALFELAIDALAACCTFENRSRLRRDHHDVGTWRRPFLLCCNSLASQPKLQRFQLFAWEQA